MCVNGPGSTPGSTPGSGSTTPGSTVTTPGSTQSTPANGSASWWIDPGTGKAYHGEDNWKYNPLTGEKLNSPKDAPSIFKNGNNTPWSYDPFTGEKLPPPPRSTGAGNWWTDPGTGKSFPEGSQWKYDPITGQPLAPGVTPSAGLFPGSTNTIPWNFDPITGKSMHAAPSSNLATGFTFATVSGSTPFSMNLDDASPGNVSDDFRKKLRPIPA